MKHVSAGQVGGSVSAQTVTILPGSSNAPLRIDENPGFTPTITFRNFAAALAATLEFDLGVNLSPTPGFFGLDELVVSLLNPTTLSPLVPGLTGSGDVLSGNHDVYTACGRGARDCTRARRDSRTGFVSLGGSGLRRLRTIRWLEEAPQGLQP